MAKLSKQQQAAALQLDAELSMYIRAAEGEAWPDTILKDEASFERFIKAEAAFDRAMASYFKDLANNRVDAWINWQEYERQARPNRQAAEIVISADAKLITEENKVLLNVIYSHIYDIERLGIDASSTIYNIPIDELTLQSTVELEARRYSSRLVTEITNATRKAMQSSLQTSIQLGEDLAAASKRINKLVDNPARATTIARTESVNSWGQGTLTFGKNTGAKGKVIDAVIDERTSPICLQLASKYGSPKNAAPIDSPFTWDAAGGGSKDAPGFHVRCRTTHYLIYK